MKDLQMENVLEEVVKNCKNSKKEDDQKEEQNIFQQALGDFLIIEITKDGVPVMTRIAGGGVPAFLLAFLVSFVWEKKDISLIRVLLMSK